MNILALFLTAFSFLLRSLIIRKNILMIFISCHKRCLGKNISPNYICEPCDRVGNIFRLLQTFLKSHYSTSMCSPLGCMKSSQVEFLVLLSSATHLIYFLLERGHSSSSEHFFPPFSLLSERFQIILATENFTDTSCTQTMENFTDTSCRPLQINTEMSVGSCMTFCRIQLYLLTSFPHL